MRQIGVISDYSDLVKLLRQRCDDLNVSRAELDEAAELPPGYSSKLLAPPPADMRISGYRRASWRMMGVKSFGAILNALGLCLIVAIDPVADRAARDLPQRKQQYVRHGAPCADSGEAQDEPSVLAAPERHRLDQRISGDGCRDVAPRRPDHPLEKA